MPIRILDPVTVTQIAAGEVIDRPASIVKELIENALDAGADTIGVDIENGGKASIVVKDNGSGISKTDLPLAPVKHATSKITALDDIYSTLTFGFRGEALASMAHVGYVDIVSRTQDSPVGYKLSTFLNDISELEPVSHTVGTYISVKDLFKNLPVRQQFWKSDATEAGYIYDIVLHHALIHPQKNFVLTHNGKELFNSTGIQTAKQLLVHSVGKDLKDRLIEVDVEAGLLHAVGVIGNPTLTYPNRAKQWLAVNGRPIKNPTLFKAIQQGFRDLIPNNRFPLAVLNIQLGSNAVDVNIHPQKQDVKFLSPGKIIEIIPNVIQSALNDTLQRSQTRSELPSSLGSVSRLFSSPPSAAPVPSSYQTAFSSFITPLSVSSDPSPQLMPQLPLTALIPDFEKQIEGSYFQLFNTYLVIKTSQSLAVLDQHAVHERILYEQIKVRAVSSGQTQPLMVAEVIDVPQDLMFQLEEAQSILSELGFVIESFGPASIAVREIPIEFSETPLGPLMLRFLELMKDVPGASPDLLLERKEKLQMMACKAAIKAGKTMTLAETQALIKDFLSSPSNYTCPHGRPLCIELDKADLEKLFLRR